MNRATIFLGLLSCFVFCFAGCAKDNIPGVVPVTGTVTLEGTAVGGATVSFIPEAEGGRSASALTESDGSFRLTSVHPNDGALPGKYKITVVKITQPEAPKYSTQEEAMAAIADKIHKGGERAVLMPSPKRKDELPAKYGNEKTSGLMGSVEASGGNDFKLELKKG